MGLERLTSQKQYVSQRAQEADCSNHAVLLNISGALDIGSYDEIPTLTV